MKGTSVRAVDYERRACARSRAAFTDLEGIPVTTQRALAISRLDQKDWKGVTVYRVQCRGGFGKGPHEVWLPERVLWALITLQSYRCPYHA